MREKEIDGGNVLFLRGLNVLAEYLAQGIFPGHSPTWLKARNAKIYPLEFQR